MDTSCFTQEQLMVRDAISKICADFPDVYSHFELRDGPR
jgi:hypothetical protein